MLMRKESIIIIGAGLTGLTLAYLLKKQGIEALLLEARDRIGGRIFTHRSEGEAPIEMGATWLGQKHTALVQLLEELQLPIFEQTLGELAVYEPISTSPPQLVQLPPNDAPSYRIAGGTDQLTQTLAAQLAPTQIQVEEAVQRITIKENALHLQSTKEEYLADKVISTLPPNLLVNSIQCTPALPEELIEKAQKTHTWMGSSIKIGLRFQDAFWKIQPKTATVFSNVGPISEFYDHSNVEGTQYALKGFLSEAYHAATLEQRKAVILKQLKRYFGEAIEQHTAYKEMLWQDEAFTYCSYPQAVLPHQNNGHPIYQQSFLEGRFLIAGSETASQFPGYMEGAVQSAQTTLRQLNG